MFLNVGIRYLSAAAILAIASILRVQAVRVNLPRQTWHASAAVLGVEAHGLGSCSSSLVAPASASHRGVLDVPWLCSHQPYYARRDLCMRSGRKNRSAGSEMFRSIAMFGDMNESSRRGRERAAKARQEKETRPPTTVTNAAPPTASAASSTASVILTDPSIRNADMFVRNKHTDEVWQRTVDPHKSTGKSSEKAEKAVSKATTTTAKETLETPDDVSALDGLVTLPWAVQEDESEDESEDAQGPEAALMRAGTKAPRKAARGRRNKAGPKKRKKQVVSVGRAEAVDWIHQAVTRFRASQISDPREISNGAADGRPVGGTEGARGELSTEPKQKDVGTTAAEEFAEIARRCLGSGLPEVALEAYSLYMRAAEAGMTPAMPLLLMQIQDDSEGPRDVGGNLADTSAAQFDGEKALLVTAARAHIVMGGTLDGLALIDDAAGLGGPRAFTSGKWGGDGEAGAGAALLDNYDASVLIEELCISGGDVGLRAALRLRERLAEEGRRLTREARLALLEALAAITARELGMSTEDTVRSLTFSGAPVAQENAAWFELLRSNARRAWCGSDKDESAGDGSCAGDTIADSVDQGRRLGGGGGWVPVGARPPGGQGMQVDGEGALVPAFDAQTAARMAQEIVNEMAEGRDPESISVRAQVAFVRAAFRSSLARVRRQSDPHERSTLSGFDASDLMLALREGMSAAEKFRPRTNKPTPPAQFGSAKASAKSSTSKPRSLKDAHLGAAEEGSATECSTSTPGDATRSTTTKARDSVSCGNNTSDVVRASTKSSTKGKNDKNKTVHDPATEATAAAITTLAGDAGFRMASALLQECLACNFSTGVETILSKMLHERQWPKTSTFNSLLWYFREQRDPEGALIILQCLRDCATVVPDKKTFALTVQACAWSGSCTDDAWAVLDEAGRAGLLSASKELLDARLILLQAAGGDISEGLRAMAAQGILLDKETCVGIIEACAKRGDTSGAVHMLDLMRGARSHGDEGGDIGNGIGVLEMCPRPSYRSYLAALQACSKSLVSGSSRGAPTSGRNTTTNERQAQENGDSHAAAPAIPGSAEHVGGGARAATSGDWRACNRILGMMWEDEAARIAAEQSAVPGSWSPGLQHALRTGPSNTTALTVAPDDLCYQLAMECCVSHGHLDEALALVSDMESRGISPNEAGLRALIKGFASEGSGASMSNGGQVASRKEAAEQRWRGVERALGVFEELAERFDPPSRASFESAIDACMAHPNGLQDAGKLISRMKEVGHDLSMDHFNVLIRGFGDARNLGAALEVYREISGDSPRRSRSWGSFEVEEDTFAALLGACTRSGEMENVSQAIRFLRSKGVSPPRMILDYLQHEEVQEIKPETWEKILGEEWTNENVRKNGISRQATKPRKYGGSISFMASVIDRGNRQGEDNDDKLDADGATSALGRTSSVKREGNQKALAFAERLRNKLILLEKKRVKSELEGEPEEVHNEAHDRGHPIGRTGIYKEVHTHAERKEEAMKRRAGEARSRVRREKRLQRARAAEHGESSDRASDEAQAAPGENGREQGLSRRARLRRKRDEEALNHRPARPLLVRIGGPNSVSSLSDESSASMNAVVAGLRRKTGLRGRQRVGGAMLGSHKKGGAGQKEAGGGSGDPPSTREKPKKRQKGEAKE